MRILFIAPRHHRKTRSSNWFIDFLQKHAISLDIEWYEEAAGGTSASIADALEKSYDRIIVWQCTQIALYAASKAPERLIFIPMHGTLHPLTDIQWQKFAEVRILSFSWALHSYLRRLGLKSVHAEYFPNPEEFKAVADFSCLRGFFSDEKPELNWPVIGALASGSPWSDFVLHNRSVPDIVASSMAAASGERDRLNPLPRGWIENTSAFEDLVGRANVFFAPTGVDSVGTSVLEAMARGQCVVAADTPPSSEHVTNNVSGLLYNPDAPEPLDLAGAAALGVAARRRIERGYSRWVVDLKDRLPEFLFAERSDLAARGPDYGTWEIRSAGSGGTEVSKGGPTLKQRVAGRPARPLVTVAMVVRNAAETFSDTFRTIEFQTYPNIEIVVVDGGSTDGTTELVRAHEAKIARWVSEPDKGLYDGMNKASRLARGRWTIFLNAGDFFYGREAVAQALDAVPPDADFVIGHHVYRTVDGVEKLYKANDFEDTWQKLISGRLSFPWLQGVPCGQAVFIPTSLFRTEGEFNYSQFPIAADHELLYRMRLKGAHFHNCDEIIAIYVGGGFSWTNPDQTARDLWRTARMYGPPRKVDEFFRANFRRRVDIDPWVRFLRRFRGIFRKGR